jgi:SAM-dependent methyltransferase
MDQPSGDGAWSRVAELLGDGSRILGPVTSGLLRADPGALAAVLARYKAVAKLAARDRSVLELQCGEGLGAPILAETARAYLGVDTREAAIDAARTAFAGERIAFRAATTLEEPWGCFDTVVWLDEISPGAGPPAPFRTLAANLAPHGRFVLGFPRPDPERLAEFSALFQRVLPFSLAQGLLLPGHAPGAGYLLAVGCSPLPGAGAP